MILHRFARVLGAVLLLAPSLALGQSALQQPCTDRTRGCTVMNLPAAADLLYQNDLYLRGLVTTRFGQLGGAAFLNVGTLTGTVADGGALAAEIIRAQAAEQANTTAITNEVSRAQGVEALKAPIASPAFTGTPTVPTAALGTSTTQAASTAFVAAAVAAGGGGGGGGVPTSRQILGGGLATGGGDLTADRTIAVPKAAQSDVATGTDDAKALTSFSVAAALGAKAPLASPALVGTPTAPTAAAGTNTTQLATTGFVTGALGSYAPLASPALTGSPTAPTQAAADNSTKLATTAYADRAATNAPAPASPSTSTTLATADANRDQFATGTITLTAANGGAGWRTGTIRNANTTSGLVTLAVPSGATLDGATNGTTVLYPYQRARIVQTGATAYVTDWVDRSPIIASIAQTGVASADLILPVGYGSFEILIRVAEPGTSGASLTARISDDAGATFKAGTNDYGYETIAAQSTSMSSNQATGSSFPVVGAVQTGNGGGKARLEIDGNPSGLFPRMTSRSGATVGGSYAQQQAEGFCASISTNRVSAVRLFWSTGTGPINATLRAIP